MSSLSSSVWAPGHPSSQQSLPKAWRELLERTLLEIVQIDELRRVNTSLSSDPDQFLVALVPQVSAAIDETQGLQKQLRSELIGRVAELISIELAPFRIASLADILQQMLGQVLESGPGSAFPSNFAKSCDRGSCR